MSEIRPIHPDFEYFLELKPITLGALYKALRNYVLSIYPDSNELFYHTHALTSVYAITPKLGSGFIHIPIYNKHLNLGFNKGNLLDDSDNLLQGTGKLIRHIPIEKVEDFKNKKVEKLINKAVAFSLSDVELDNYKTKQSISKIKMAK